MELDDIRKEVDRLASKINAPDNLLPTYGYSNDFGYPHIETTGSTMHYVIVERGQELKRNSTLDINQLLYWIFADVTFSMAGKYESAHRAEDKDCRRIMFAHQEELLGLLNIDWRDKEETDHQNILKRYPFDDLAGLRATYCRELRSKGYNENEINKLAYEKYPS